jgi:hypothetical protein
MLNGKQPRVTTKEIPETDLNAPCERCGHLKGQHAQFIDNQSSSATYTPERRHCLYLGGDGMMRVDNMCSCTRFMLSTTMLDRVVATQAAQAAVQRERPSELPRLRALEEVRDELARARAAWPNMNTSHEGYAIILEELDELWELVRVKQDKHDRKAMRKEAMQIAAMAIRFMEDLCEERE